VIADVGRVSAFMAGAASAVGGAILVFNDLRRWWRRRRGEAIPGRERFAVVGFWSGGIGSLIALGTILAVLDRVWPNAYELAVAVAAAVFGFGTVGFLLWARADIKLARETTGAPPGRSNRVETELDERRGNRELSALRRFVSSVFDRRVIRHFALSFWMMNITWLNADVDSFIFGEGIVVRRASATSSRRSLTSRSGWGAISASCELRFFRGRCSGWCLSYSDSRSNESRRRCEAGRHWRLRAARIREHKTGAYARSTDRRRSSVLPDRAEQLGTLGRR
jgi:hypothetical protein